MCTFISAQAKVQNWRRVMVTKIVKSQNEVRTLVFRGVENAVLSAVNGVPNSAFCPFRQLLS